MTKKICPYCKTEFTTKNTQQIYCKSTCKVYASQERTGKRDKREMTIVEQQEQPTKEELQMQFDKAKKELQVIEENFNAAKENWENSTEVEQRAKAKELIEYANKVRKLKRENNELEIQLLDLNNASIFNYSLIEDRRRLQPEFNFEEQVFPKMEECLADYYHGKLYSNNLYFYLLDSFGVLPDPFIFLVRSFNQGPWRESTTIFFSEVIARLLVMYDYSILFITDEKNLSRFNLKEVSRSSRINDSLIKKDLFNIYVTEEKAEAFRKLKMESFDIAFVNVSSFSPNYTEIKQIKKETKKSVFWAIDFLSTRTNLIADCILNYDDGIGSYRKGGNEEAIGGAELYYFFGD